MAGDRDLAAAPRWHGAPGRLEVWYATCTDAASGSGVWVHQERRVPHDGGPPVTVGWLALFPADADPAWTGFGPEPCGDGAGAWLTCASASVRDGVFAGETGGGAWEIGWQDDGVPLWTFPRAAWARELLPAAQVVVGTGGRFTGTATIGDRTLVLHDATGAAAHIYGHGNARRWGWLHADLPDGDAVVEVVTAVSTRRGLDRLPPLAFVRIRHDGRDLPSLPVSPLVRTVFRDDGFRVRGLLDHRHRVDIDVELPVDRCVRIPYADPDGATATCTNTERADVMVRLARRDGRRWRTVVDERLAATAHAELGTRP